MGQCWHGYSLTELRYWCLVWPRKQRLERSQDLAGIFQKLYQGSGVVKAFGSDAQGDPGNQM